MNQNHRNKKKLSKISTEINFELLQDELKKNNKYRHKSKPNRKRRADRR